MTMKKLMIPISLIVCWVALTEGFLAIQLRHKYSDRLLRAKATDMSTGEHDKAMEKATKSMTAFTNAYLKNTGTKLCTDKSVPAVVIKGLAEHKVTLGSPLCPCRFYEDKEAEVKDGYWNCPCVPMRERHECHCMLFLTDDNTFAGNETSITVDEVMEYTKKLST